MLARFEPVEVPAAVRWAERDEVLERSSGCGDDVELHVCATSLAKSGRGDADEPHQRATRTLVNAGYVNCVFSLHICVPLFFPKHLLVRESQRNRCFVRQIALFVEQETSPCSRITAVVPVYHNCGGPPFVASSMVLFAANFSDFLVSTHSIQISFAKSASKKQEMPC